MCEFETKIRKNLESLHINLKSDCRLGVAVSGGADSVSLLYSLAEIFKDFDKTLYVITVNHNIREKEETRRDAEYVNELCEILCTQGYKIKFTMAEIPPGIVKKTAEDRKSGIEESARFIRYNIFENFISENSLDYLCLAHNQNDQLETVLMRFLQGASVEALAGIKMKRDKYIRPLMTVTREEIEEYLHFKNVSWRTDSTNLDTKYLRNKIRLKLVPLLNEQFPGWQKAVLNEAFQFARDGEVFAERVENFPIIIENNMVSFKSENFFSEPESIKIRILRKAANLTGENARIPVDFLKDVINSFKSESSVEISKFFHRTIFCKKNNTVFVKNDDKIHTEISFFAIIEETGNLNFPFGVLRVEKSGDSEGLVSLEGYPVTFTMELPFIVRNIRPGDEIKTADSKMKKLADIFSDWHVSEQDKYRIPVFQKLDGEEQSLQCILGSFLGYKDWIVK